MKNEVFFPSGLKCLIKQVLSVRVSVTTLVWSLFGCVMKTLFGKVNLDLFSKSNFSVPKTIHIFYYALLEC